MPSVSNQTIAMLKTWVKTFIVGVMLLYSTGDRSWYNLINAGVGALLPVVYAWLDPSDTRYGRGITTKKKVSSKAK